MICACGRPTRKRDNTRAPVCGRCQRIEHDLHLTENSYRPAHEEPQPSPSPWIGRYAVYTTRKR